MKTAAVFISFLSFYIRLRHKSTTFLTYLCHRDDPSAKRHLMRYREELLKPPSCHSLPLKGNFYVRLFYCSRMDGSCEKNPEKVTFR